MTTGWVTSTPPTASWITTLGSESPPSSISAPPSPAGPPSPGAAPRWVEGAMRAVECTAFNPPSTCKRGQPMNAITPAER
eukprot:1494628-Pyramimonas_sp.AAC.2